MSQDGDKPADKPEELKMWIAIRTDIAMPLGKLAAQVGHAFHGIADEVWIDATLGEHNSLYQEYMKGGRAKIAVRADSESALLRVAKECQDEGIPSCLIQDAGRTVFAEPTYTVCAFGPTLRSALPPFLRRLRLYE